MNPTNDAEILKALNKGDIHAFELLYKTHVKLLWGEAYRILEDKQSADDAVQELFIEFWEKKYFEKIETNIRAYLFTSIRRKCYKLQNSSFHFEEMNSSFETTLQATVQNHEAKDIQKGIAEAMAEMPAQPAKVFELYILEGKKRKEVAQILGISDNTTKSHLSTAMKIVRKKLLIFKKSTPI